MLFSKEIKIFKPIGLKKPEYEKNALERYEDIKSQWLKFNQKIKRPKNKPTLMQKSD